jgi:hypothetical protein
MLTVLWNPNGFDFPDVLSNEGKFTASYYVNKDLSEFRNGDKDKDRGQLENW